MRLLLAGEPAHSILCITYTKIAAGEMRERLHRRLSELRRMDEDTLRVQLANQLGREANESDITRARGLAISLLEQADSIQFHTIHAFCERILRQFPIEANVVPHYVQLDDRVAEELRQRAYSRVLDEALSVPTLQQAFAVLQASMKDGAIEALLLSSMQKRREWLALFGETSNTDASLEVIRKYFSPSAGNEISQRFTVHYDDAWQVRCREVIAHLTESTTQDQNLAVQFSGWLSALNEGAWDAYASGHYTQGQLKKRYYTAGLAKRYTQDAQFLDEERAFVVDFMQSRARLLAYQLSGSVMQITHRLLALYEE